MGATARACGPRPCPPDFTSSSSWRRPPAGQHPPLVSWPNACVHGQTDSWTHTHTKIYIRHSPRDTCACSQMSHTETQRNRYRHRGDGSEPQGWRVVRTWMGSTLCSRTPTRGDLLLWLEAEGEGSQQQCLAGPGLIEGGVGLNW